MNSLVHKKSKVRRGKAVVALPAIILALYLVSPMLSMQLRPQDYVSVYAMSDEAIQRRNSNAFAMLLGEFRANISDLMFIKTERYLDSGVAYMPHLDMDSMAEGEEEKASAERRPPASATEMAARQPGHETDHDHEHDHEHEHEHEHEAEEEAVHAEEDHEHDDHSGTPTIIPSPPEDFRGFIGWLHREVKPWRDPSLPHEHTPGEELLPWYRVMTISNPNNVRAYLIGAWWLKSEGGRYNDEALKFLDEGIDYNPKAFQLYLMRGYVYIEQEKMEEALENLIRASEFAAEARPAGGPTETSRWTEYQEEDARAAMRLAVVLERRHGSEKKALELAKKYNQVLGGDGRLEAQIAEME